MTDYEKKKLAETVKALSEEEQAIVIANLPKDKMISYLLMEAEKRHEVLEGIKSLLGGAK